MIKQIYKAERKHIEEGEMVNPLNVELCAMLERALNYMHTGNTKVIATTVMNPLWIGKALIQDGLPCVDPGILRVFASSWELCAEHYPYHRSTGIPTSAAGCVIRYNYGDTVFQVSQCFIPPRDCGRYAGS